VLEEAVIFVYEDSMQGNLARHQPLLRFLDVTLDFVELAITKHFQEYFPSVKACLTKVWDRLQVLMQKKENAILNHFMQNLEDSSDQVSKLTEDVFVLS
jgi:hypothetical protein